MPQSCLGDSLGPRGIWTALFQYEGLSVVYESGINQIPDFDSCVEVFSASKSVRVDFDTPYVKGLPVTMTIREKVDGRPGTGSNGFRESTVRRTYEDAYSLELEDFYRCVVDGATPKTHVHDARQDIDLFAMILRAGEKNYNS
jgi:predicted dehydrogenase